MVKGPEFAELLPGGRPLGRFAACAGWASDSVVVFLGRPLGRGMGVSGGVGESAVDLLEKGRRWTLAAREDLRPRREVFTIGSVVRSMQVLG